MKAVEFSINLKNLAPSVEKLMQQGLSKQASMDFIESYDCFPKITDKHPLNGLHDLIANFDLSRVKIGMITFCNKITKINSYLQVGNFELDLLVEDMTSGEIMTIDYTEHENVMQKCALDGDHFLDAILVAAKFLTECIFIEGLSDDYEMANIVAKECSIKAGGMQYFDFFDTMLF